MVSLTRRLKLGQARPLQIASDCSGLGSDAIALARLGLPFRVKYCSDICPAARGVLTRSKWKPKKIFHRARLNACQTRKLDVYTAGFPCQSFSKAGRNKGFSDGRSRVVRKIIKKIIQYQPKVWVLENVCGLMSKTHKALFHIFFFLRVVRTSFVFFYILAMICNLESSQAFFRKILRQLRQAKLEGHSRRAFVMHVNVVNTADYGVPQRRKRLYVIGVKNAADASLKRPRPIMHKPDVAPAPLSSIIIKRRATTILQKTSATARKNIRWAKRIIQERNLSLSEATLSLVIVVYFLFSQEC